MTQRGDAGDRGISRRGLLSTGAAGLAATSGCLGRLRTVVGRERPDPITLRIKTLPVDEDPFALLIAREMAEWFRSAGIDASVVPMAGEELLQQVLVNHEFDVFVARYPAPVRDPDALYALLHSRFNTEPGWQNPFGFANLGVDEQLTAQRRASGQQRTGVADDLQTRLARQQPFTVVAFPDVIRTARSDRFSGFAGADLGSPVGYLQLSRTDPVATELRATTTDPQVTTSLNPLMAAFSDRALATDLVYDSLGRRLDGEIAPWLAQGWEWTADDPPVLEATLRPETTWHDGESLTAEDVAFSYEFLADTSLGEADQPVPAMRYRGRVSLVDAASALSDRRVEIQFTHCSPAVARRGLTVPVLPAHVWRERTGEATIGGFDVGGRTTAALVTNNVPAVGSGPLAFESATRDDALVLSRFDDHFLAGDAVDDLPDALVGGPPYERLTLAYVGSDAAAIEVVASGSADVTAGPVGTNALRRIGRSDDLDLVVTPSTGFYFAGYNARRAPLGNPRFRQLLGRLVDRDHLRRTVFTSFATPAVSPLARTEWGDESLSDGESAPTTSFLGAGGSVNEERAREAFRAAGYRYDEAGRLLRG